MHRGDRSNLVEKRTLRRAFRPPVRVAGALAALATLAVACGGGTATGPGSATTATTAAPAPGGGTTASSAPGRPPGTVKVPQDHPTIQAAIDAAVPGDVVLVSPGTYKESVVIETDRIVLRGTERAGVVIDGEGKRENGVKVLAAGVAVENLTVQDHAANGVLVTGDGYEDGEQVSGFRLRYLTSLRNELYGVYTFAAQDGTIDHVYASGSADAGIYVGRCDPCDTLVTDNLVEHNGVGFVGTNASTGLVVAANTFRANRVGVTLNSQDLEKKAPQHDAVVVGNVVDGAEAAVSPAQGSGGFGLGIAIGGGRNDQVLRNRVVGNVGAGIVVTDLERYEPQGIRLIGNVLRGNAIDVAAYRTVVPQLAIGALCLGSNELATTVPADLAATNSCDGGTSSTVSQAAPRMPSSPPGVKPEALPPPPADLPSLADATGAAEAVTTDVVLPDLATFGVPA